MRMVVLFITGLKWAVTGIKVLLMLIGFPLAWTMVTIMNQEIQSVAKTYLNGAVIENSTTNRQYRRRYFTNFSWVIQI